MRKILLFWDSASKNNFKDYSESLKEIARTGKSIIRWNLTTNFKRVSMDDCVILWCKGKGAVGMGKIIQEPFKLKPSSKENYIKCELNILFNHNLKFISIKDIKEVDPLFVWKNYQKSGREIEENHFNIISNLLKNSINTDDVDLDEEKELKELEYIEGAVIQKLVNGFERNLDARKKCIDYHKPICSCCKIDFGNVYGPRGEGYIHVHHLLPLKKIKKSYKVNPIKDLRPVCPNCHAIIHRGKETLTIEQVKKLYTAKK